MFKRIFCPVDGSDISSRAIATAVALAKEQSANLCFFHVIDIGPLLMYVPPTENCFDSVREAGRTILENAMATAAAAGLTAEPRTIEIVSGRPGQQIAEAAAKYQADVIVMGTHGRQGVSKFFLGSDAATAVATTAIPVLLIK